MTRFYESVLGQYDASRGQYAAGTPMPKAEALREAKCWLRTRPRDEIKTALQKLNVPVSGDRATLDTQPGGRPRPPGDPYDFLHPYYWAAFILIGDPE
jgi:CHAT domain-containing protein